ncbi:hypothetical protein [uncultured Akkermansia sp.]|jgi:hypothetical protein|uniref:hypothetical protein n=1 Tax=uncultured Akkermansia sp. TaxID=512294 RepID=UPI0025E48ADE|nr:hypothetical protein [uncultured Akkermansia sp.]
MKNNTLLKNSSNSLLESSLQILCSWFPEEAPQLQKYKQEIFDSIEKGTKPSAMLSTLSYASEPLSLHKNVQSEVWNSPCVNSIMLFSFGTVCFIVGMTGLKLPATPTPNDVLPLMADVATPETYGHFRELIRIFNESESKIQKAKAIFDLGKELWGTGVFKAIFKYMADTMTWFDWATTSVKTLAQLVAWFATGGAAFAAQAVMLLVDAVSLIKSGKEVHDNCFTHS